MIILKVYIRVNVCWVISPEEAQKNSELQVKLESTTLQILDG